MIHPGIGIHAAIDTFKDWPEGAGIIGATFAGHPWGPAGTWAVKLAEPNHPLLRAWGGKDFKLHDEFYEMGAPFTRADRRVLTLEIDLGNQKPSPRAAVAAWPTPRRLMENRSSLSCPKR